VVIILGDFSGSKQVVTTFNDDVKNEVDDQAKLMSESLDENFTSGKKVFIYVMLHL